MAIPKKGSRKIIVDGKPFRYMFTKVSYGTTTLTVQENAPKAGCVMQFQFEGRDNSITPKDVIDLISRAKEKGWNPSEKGGVFYFHYDPPKPVANSDIYGQDYVFPLSHWKNS